MFLSFAPHSKIENRNLNGASQRSSIDILASVTKSTTMGKLTLKQGETYSLKITGITTDGKCIVTKKRGECFRYFIDLVDKLGNGVRAEYLSPYNDGTPFASDIFQYIKCTAVASGFEAYTIEPGEEPTTLSSMARDVNSIISAKGTPLLNSPEPLPYKPNCHVANIQGTSIAFSMAYAKDILVAEIAASGRLPTKEDVNRMLMWSTMINDHICEKINLERNV